MRKDMKKVLVTEGRYGSTWSNQDAKRLRRERITLYEDEEGWDVDPQLHGRSAGMRPKGWPRKHFGEHLGPLKRFLQSRVGKHWDKIYSEISEAFPPGGPVLGHVYDHLWGYVRRAEEIEVREDGKLIGKMGGRTWFFGQPGEPFGWREPYYVCPKSGCLRASPTRSRRPKATDDPALHRVEDRFFVLRAEDQVWFEVERGPVEAGCTPGSELKRLGFAIDGLTWPTIRALSGHRLSIRTLSRREKRDLGLR